METVEYGATLHGIPCRFDKNAAEADAVLCINRVKSHTSFDRPIESGLTKLIAVGLGKQVGAQNVHRLGPRGYTEVLPQLARIAIDHSPIAFGIALVENADKQLVVIEGRRARRLRRDRRAPAEGGEDADRAPAVRDVDGLIVEWIGKEISGAGMDPAVVGRVGIRSVPDPGKPFVNKLAVLGVTEDSYGNAIGLGNADYTTRKVANHIDLLPMYMNSITAAGTESARVPAVLADDRTVIQAMVATCWRSDLENARLCQIRSTLYLHEILVSPSLYTDIEGRPDAERLSDPAPLRVLRRRRAADPGVRGGVQVDSNPRCGGCQLAQSRRIGPRRLASCMTTARSAALQATSQIKAARRSRMTDGQGSDRPASRWGCKRAFHFAGTGARLL